MLGSVEVNPCIAQTREGNIMKTYPHATSNAVRPLHAIAYDIVEHWENPRYSAKPYIVAMFALESLGDMYGFDSADSIVRYFLSNASTWKGEHARRIKAELKRMLEGGK
jgi:hypothetical protein